MKNNRYLSQKLYEYAEYIEALGSHPYKIRAYRKASYLLDTYPDDVTDLIQKGADLNVKGIGKGICSILQIIIETGAFRNIISFLRNE